MSGNTILSAVSENHAWTCNICNQITLVIDNIDSQDITALICVMICLTQDKKKVPFYIHIFDKLNHNLRVYSHLYWRRQDLNSPIKPTIFHENVSELWRVFCCKLTYIWQQIPPPLQSSIHSQWAADNDGELQSDRSHILNLHSLLLSPLLLI